MSSFFHNLLLDIKKLGNLTTETFPPRSKFVPARDIPDLTGKVVIVTGGNAGLGKETIRQLLLKNAKVYMASRSESRARTAIQELQAETGKEALFLNLDLANLDAVSAAAREFMSKESELHILFNSGGVMFPRMDQFTADGFDLQFGTNVLGHAHFTLSLLPALLTATQSSPPGTVRVVNTASSAIYMAPPSGILWESLKDGPARARVTTRTLYGQSKLGNAIFAREFARRYGDQGIVSISLNPGNIKTDLWTNVPKLVMTLFVNRVLYSVPQGALTQLYAGTSPEASELNGKYLIPWARVGKGSPNISDPTLGEKLWEWIEDNRKSH